MMERERQQNDSLVNGYPGRRGLWPDKRGQVRSDRRGLPPVVHLIAQHLHNRVNQLPRRRRKRTSG